MKREEIYRLSLAAMLLAVGYVLPLLTGQIREIGNMLLPMHIPVMLTGLLCGARYGFAVGLIMPVTRSLIFGMPAMFPNAVGMSAELATYGLVIGLLYASSRHKCIFALYRSLIISRLVGRAAWGLVMTALLGFFADGFTLAAFLSGAFLNALPGIAVQLVLIPAVMLLARRAHLPHLAKKERNNK